MDQFQHVKGHFGVVFPGQSSGEVNSAVQISCKDGNIIITLDPVDQFQHVKGHFGVMFPGQYSGEVKSAVQLYKSADRIEISL